MNRKTRSQGVKHYCLTALLYKLLAKLKMFTMFILFDRLELEKKRHSETLILHSNIRGIEKRRTRPYTPKPQPTARGSPQTKHHEATTRREPKTKTPKPRPKRERGNSASNRLLGDKETPNEAEHLPKRTAERVALIL